MATTFYYTRNIDGGALKEMLESYDLPEIIRLRVIKNADGSIPQDNVTIEFATEPTGPQLDELDTIMDLPNLEERLQAYIQMYQKQERGEQLYQKIMADINLSGAIPGYLDDTQIPIYLEMNKLRNMLKDGAFEFSIRYFVFDMIPISPFTTEQHDKWLGWIEELALEYGTEQALIDLLKTVPKGNYPFGATGAPE